MEKLNGGELLWWNMLLLLYEFFDPSIPAMRKVYNRKTEKNRGEKIVATKVVTSPLPGRQTTGTPTARGKNGYTFHHQSSPPFNFSKCITTFIKGDNRKLEKHCGIGCCEAATKVMLALAPSLFWAWVSYFSKASLKYRDILKKTCMLNPN